MRHRQAVSPLLYGLGIEIGAFHRPMPLPEGCRVVRCDVRSLADALRVYPELYAEQLAPVDVVCDMDKGGLAAFADGSFDFVVFNQVIEHLANPIQAIGEVFRVTKLRGLVVIATHDRLYAPDRKRPSPSFQDLLEAYRSGASRVDDAAYEAFLRAVHPRVFGAAGDELARGLQAVRERREAAHAWDSRTFQDFLGQTLKTLGISALCLYESLGQDNRIEYFSVWQKCREGDQATVTPDELRKIVSKLTQRVDELREEIDSLLLTGAAHQADLEHIRASRTWRWSELLRCSIGRMRTMIGLPTAIARHVRAKGTIGAVLADAMSVGRKNLDAGQGLWPVVRATLHHVRSTPVATVAAVSWSLESIVKRYDITPHQSSVDVIVCVHNALDDVRHCLSSLVRYTLPPVNLILIDDGSEMPTRDYLDAFAREQDATLIRNLQARGYTYAANQGLQAGFGEYAVLLNSDTVVTADWLDRLIMCAESARTIGIVGPLSNTASWQSIPEIEEGGDWAVNPLPEGVTIARMAQLVASCSTRLYPRIAFLNGFCLLIKRAVIESIGYFDEQTFGCGYGEENDYCLRAKKAGWELAIADDVYVYHAQSKSYSHERRKILCDQGGVALVAKHGHAIIEQGVRECREDRVLRGIRVRAKLVYQRQGLIDRGRAMWEGRRILFVMPVMAAGGGANVVITEARAMLAMGVDVHILNLRGIRGPFEESYPELDIPMVYVDSEKEFADIALSYDAVIATANHTVRWLATLSGLLVKPKIGYYIQDFEPYFFESNTAAYRTALDSYNLIPDMCCLTKTAWNRGEVLKHTGLGCVIVGPSYDVDLFMPRRQMIARSQGCLRVCAMVRPSSGRRQPELTMKVLRRLHRLRGDHVDIVIFGVADDDPEFVKLPRDFAFHNAGLCTPEEMAALLNEMDIFADFSTYQAMGLTAMEAMSCGVAVLVPMNGGASSFAQDQVNALFVNTETEAACLDVLLQLVDNTELRQALQQQALSDIAQYYPERVGYAILDELFSSKMQ